ncbi:GyrI-like domain-containing protein [Salegentibacter sp. LM13S]|uniref:GyrI-like domain-containing protein n=1 Tax=Salegentibacter lacus TaxID=2873599 RepID=UPI001CCA059E|nr:GyrI-like domain-containing protein [Salegentibacter lacus]MBZ9630185.1 GyrI-like domain-containing protein [Salegentibacter lacus]
MSKKIWLLLLCGIPVLFLLWYFVIKNNDYAITFETKALPSEIVYLIDSPVFDKMQINNSEIKSNFSQVIQDAQLGAEFYDLNWNIEPKNDSITKVKLSVTNQNNSLKDRFLLLIGQNDFQKKMRDEIVYFKDALTTYLELYKVKIEGKTSSPKNTCACITTDSKVDQKAFEMMKTIDILSNYILNNDLETLGRPRILINSWDKKAENINFSFCFPIAEMKTYPKDLLIEIKEIPSEKALKASFHGNYMFSHNAWLHLINYAEKHNIEVKTENILEVFQNNPQLGGDESQWEAEIYLPLAE